MKDDDDQWGDIWLQVADVCVCAPPQIVDFETLSTCTGSTWARAEMIGGWNRGVMDGSYCSVQASEAGVVVYVCVCLCMYVCVSMCVHLCVSMCQWV